MRSVTMLPDVLDVQRTAADRWAVRSPEGATAGGPVNLALLARGIEAARCRSRASSATRRGRSGGPLTEARPSSPREAPQALPPPPPSTDDITEPGAPRDGDDDHRGRRPRRRLGPARGAAAPARGRGAADRLRGGHHPRGARRRHRRRGVRARPGDVDVLGDLVAAPRCVGRRRGGRKPAPPSRGRPGPAGQAISRSTWRRPACPPRALRRCRSGGAVAATPRSRWGAAHGDPAREARRARAVPRRGAVTKIEENGWA